jgi:hypothetical protein
MPTTVIKVRTYMCVHGVGNVDSSCRFHRAVDNMPEDGKCPTCDELLVLATQPEDKMTITVMGEETIEVEIEGRDEAMFRTQCIAEANAQTAQMDTDGEFPTERARERFRAVRHDDVEQLIKELKAQPESNLSGPTFRASGYFLVTDEQILNYRTRRLDDIARAIVEARKSEDT